MKLAFAILHLGKNGMEVITDHGGKRRHCNLTWSTSKTSDLPPEDWPSQVMGELNFQDGAQAAGTAFIG